MSPGGRVILTAWSKNEMRITEKGQVTIPQAIREAGGFMPGTDVEMELRDGEVLVRRAKPGASKKKTRGELVVEALAGKANYGMSTDDFIRLMRGPSADEEIAALEAEKKKS